VGDFWKHFIIGFSALLPIVNPLGSALEVLSIVGRQSEETYKSLARKIALSTVLFFIVIGLIGSYLLQFFGISLNILQVAGGFVVIGIGWSLLNRPDEIRNLAADCLVPDCVDGSSKDASPHQWDSKIFYPLTFPITAGPGCVAVMLTLSAHASGPSVGGELFAYLGLLVAVLAICVLVYFSYAYAPRLTRRISPDTVNGIVRVIAFLLLCIGAQIAWNGLQPLLITLLSATHTK
jgi:multiple antibiotic resistance protein